MEQIGRASKRRAKPPSPLVKTISEALAKEDPISALWPSLIATVFTDKANPKLDNLSKPCQALYLMDLLDREVQNGGFDQFFYNSSGRFCDETRKALEETGARSLLYLFERACTVFPGGNVPKDDTERRALMSTLTEDAKALLSELDSEFNSKINSSPNQTNSPENPWFLAVQYMRAHENDLIASAVI